uniref:Secreted protein n=1 Tax=Periophthalmus magnuspinnatus TaxID=409849 RepID=A0A3B3ZDG1_9GOBI
MFLQRSTYLVAFLLCSLSVWCKMASAGSSYLSPSHKPQVWMKIFFVDLDKLILKCYKRVNETKHNSRYVSAPFALDFTFNEQDFDDYAAIVQRILKNLLGDTPAEES